MSTCHMYTLPELMDHFSRKSKVWLLYLATLLDRKCEYMLSGPKDDLLTFKLFQIWSIITHGPRLTLCLWVLSATYTHTHIYIYIYGYMCVFADVYMYIYIYIFYPPLEILRFLDKTEVFGQTGGNKCLETLK